MLAVRQCDAGKTFDKTFSNSLLERNVRGELVVNWPIRVVLLWFCITSISDWFKVPAPLFQPITSETKTNRGSRVYIFPRFVSATCNYFEF